MRLLVYLGLAWLALLAQPKGRITLRGALAAPAAGLLTGWAYHLFFIRCPRCRRSIGHLARSLIDFSLFRFPKRVRFCPYCMTDFEDDLE